MKKRKKRSDRRGRKTAGRLTWLRSRRFYAAAGVLAAAIFAYFMLRWYVGGTYHGLGAQDTYPASTVSAENFYWENGLRYYKDDAYTSEVGIDVSAYQGEIDWQSVKDAGISFVMIRVGYRGNTEGNICQDERFSENLKGARDAGLKVGVYFYSEAVSVEEAEEEAKFVIRSIRGKGVTLPVAFDMEMSESARHQDLTAEERTKITDAFCTIVEENGYQPMVYGNPTWLTGSVDLRYLTGYSLWLANYAETPSFTYAFKMWQYSNTGTVPGVTGDCDMDLCLLKR